MARAHKDTERQVRDFGLIEDRIRMVTIAPSIWDRHSISKLIQARFMHYTPVVIMLCGSPCS